MHSARSATPPAAAKLRAGQLQMITKNPQQRCVALAVKRYFLGVNSKADHVLLPSCSRSAANQSYIIAIDARIHCTVQRDEACQIHGEASLSREQESGAQIPDTATADPRRWDEICAYYEITENYGQP